MRRRHYIELSDGRRMWEDDDRIESIDGEFLKVGDKRFVIVLEDRLGFPNLLRPSAISIPPPRDLLAEVEKAIDDEGICGKYDPLPRRPHFGELPHPTRDEGDRMFKQIHDQFPHDSDPHGIPQHAPGAKLDAEKPRVGLVMDGFALALLEVAKVGTYGAKKYSDNGWMSVANGEQRYKDAMLRHALQSSYEEQDEDSGLMHLAQVAWNALATLQKHLEAK